MTRSLRVGLFGLLGSGNLGNDGSLEAVLGYLRTEHPDIIVDAFCAGPAVVQERYGIETTRLNWYRNEYRTASTLRAVAMKGFGKLVDAFRTAAWVRRHDVVIVPGMGVLEATLPLRPWGFPYALLLLTLSGRLTGTKVLLVSVGASEIRARTTRTVVGWAARLASYRSFRDEPSRDAMTAAGVNTAQDEVYPDLAFALHIPEPAAVLPGSVGVGVMAYSGGNDDRENADEIYRSYVDAMKRCVTHLVSEGRQVRLFVGDEGDRSVVEEILGVTGTGSVTAATQVTLTELMQEMAAMEFVVATRYHNVLCSLRLAKPTISLGYARKNDVLMESMGLGEFCQRADDIDFDRLVEQFDELVSRAGEVSENLAKRNLEQRHLLERQAATLSATYLSGGRR